MDTSKAAAALGRKGGKAGTGASKRRGGSGYYRALRAHRAGAEGHMLGMCPVCIKAMTADWAAQEQASNRCDNGCDIRCARTIGHDGPCAR
jgi:hypothetical protein